MKIPAPPRDLLTFPLSRVFMLKGAAAAGETRPLIAHANDPGYRDIPKPVCFPNVDRERLRRAASVATSLWGFYSPRAANTDGFSGVITGKSALAAQQRTFDPHSGTFVCLIDPPLARG